jgi:hypothetical protein
MTKSMLGFYLLLVSLAPLHAGANIVSNPGFEKGMEMWSSEAFAAAPDAVQFAVNGEGAQEGSFSLVITNLQPNDSKVIQWLKVKPETLYRLSCQVKVANADLSRRGASITVLGIDYTSKDIHDTRGAWEPIELYGKTGPEQESLALALRLGFYGSLTTGTAGFDSVRMEKVPSAPKGETVVNLFTDEAVGSALESIHKEDFNPVGLAVIGFFLLTAIAAVSMMAGIVLSRSRPGRRVVETKPFLERAAEAVHDRAELRRAPRKKIGILASIKKNASDGGYRIITFQIRDISSCGTFILSEDISIFTVGEEVMLNLVTDGEEYGLGTSMVVRSEKGFDKNGVLLESGYGVMFMSPEAAACMVLI